MKKNIVMVISIGCVAFILTMLMFTQFKTVEETDIIAIETMRESDLRSELATWKEKYEELSYKVDEKQQKIDEYKLELNNDANASTLLEKEVKEAETYLGYTDLQGQGIVVTLADNDMHIIYYSDLLSLVNELNIAGAEAICINDERIVSTSEITLINNRIILINKKRISGPYTIKARGDKKYLESALTIKGGYIDLLKNEGKDINYTVEDNIVIPAFEGELNSEYLQVYKEEQEG